CRFLAAYPDLSVDLDERPSKHIALAIAEGRADLGIVADVADLTALETYLLTEDQLVVVANRTHRIAALKAVTFGDIVREPFVGLADAALEIHLGEQASRLGCQMHYRVLMRNVEDVGMLVEAGVGLAILSEASAAGLDRPGLAILPLSEPWALRRLYLCARNFSALTPHAALLTQYLMVTGGV
ncbi:MAG: LysR family transcriptional regulator, partial [Rhizobiaceae bacterium]|nr:LysR family transcriptional regulator [Rhizobiaceae bacterium]